MAKVKNDTTQVVKKNKIVTPVGYQWQVGISFLSQDEAFAKRLSDELKEITTVYFYRDHEHEQAWQDSEDIYYKVFSKNIVSAIVLYREGWGTKGIPLWERMGIKDIASDDNRGLDCIMFINLDKSPVQFNWYPKRLYYTYDNQFEELVKYIVLQLKKVNVDVFDLTPQQKLRLIAKKEVFRKERDEYLYKSHGEGWANAIEEHVKLFKIYHVIMTEHCAVLNRSFDEKLHTHNDNITPVWYSLDGKRIAFYWRQYWGHQNNLRKNILYVYAGESFDEFQIDWNRIATRKYFATVNQNYEHGWALMNEPDIVYTSQQVVEMLYSDYLNVTQKHFDNNNKQRHLARYQ